MATCSSVLAWEIPWTEEPGRLQSTGSRRVGHNLVTEHAHILHPGLQGAHSVDWGTEQSAGSGDQGVGWAVSSSNTEISLGCKTGLPGTGSNSKIVVRISLLIHGQMRK